MSDSSATARCGAAVSRRVSNGIKGKGTETFGTKMGICGRPCAEGSDLCAMHVAAAARMSVKLAAKRARSAK